MNEDINAKRCKTVNGQSSRMKSGREMADDRIESILCAAFEIEINKSIWKREKEK